MSNANEIIDMLEELGDQFTEEAWRDELGINDGYTPVIREEEDTLELPEFEMEEDELLINRGE